MTKSGSIRFQYNGATAYSCAIEGSVRSPGGYSVQFYFGDVSSHNLEVAPIDPSGAVGLFSPIGPAGDTTNAAIGSYWVVRSSSGCVVIFKVTGTGEVSLSDVVK